MKYKNELRSAAAALGRLGGMKGGKSKSAAKVAAARANGRKGGRPKGAKNKAKWCAKKERESTQFVTNCLPQRETHSNK